MERETRNLRRGDCLTPTDIELLWNPLEFLLEDHMREREICKTLDQIAAREPVGQESVSQVVNFLKEELPFHLADEEEDLFPAMRRRCHPEDEIKKAITRLTADHRHAGAATPDVIAIAEMGAQALRSLTDEQCAILNGYASHARRHLILENAIILPLARRRLGKAELEGIRAGMLKRRGLDQLVKSWKGSHMIHQHQHSR